MSNYLLDTFFRAGLIEAWGRGTLRILQDCKLAQAPIPIFKYHLGGFSIEFDLKTSDKIIELIKQKPNITIKALATIMGISDRAVEFQLQNLKKNNQITRKGGKKGGEWIIIGQ
jgi:ATP-dependent DNA helicase RecG